MAFTAARSRRRNSIFLLALEPLRYKFLYVDTHDLRPNRSLVLCQTEAKKNF